MPSPHPSELVEQMPDTDQELSAKSEASPAPASKFTGAEPDAARGIYDQLLDGGSESLEELLKLVRMPGEPDYKNDKPIYVVHGLVIYVGAAERSSQRRLLVAALGARLGQSQCSQLSKGFFLRQLQLIPDDAVLPVVAPYLVDEELCADAAQALAAFGPASKRFLEQALPEAGQRARRLILHALGRFGDSH